jgi:hypothetical protein
LGGREPLLHAQPSTRYEQHLRDALKEKLQSQKA